MQRLNSGTRKCHDTADTRCLGEGKKGQRASELVVMDFGEGLR